jgi:hypothetical protein
MSEFRVGENQGKGDDHAADYELVDDVLPGSVTRDLFGRPIKEMILGGDSHLDEHVDGGKGEPGENGQQQKMNEVHRDLGSAVRRDPYLMSHGSNINALD